MSTSRTTVDLLIFPHPCGSVHTYTVLDSASSARLFSDYAILRDGQSWEEIDASMMEIIVKEFGLNSAGDITLVKPIDPVAIKTRAKIKRAQQQLPLHLSVVRG